MAETGRLALPLLEAGQARKEMTVNEALARLDLAVQAKVEAVGVSTPPVAPVEGQGWIVGDSPNGAWTGKAAAIAGWTAGGWRFLAAREGMRVWSAADGTVVTHSGGAWRSGLLIGGLQVVGTQAAAIGTVTGGSVVDVEARAALGAILVALRAHGLIAI